MDGVLWHGDTPVPGLKDFFETLKRLNLKFVLATNNATKVSRDYSKKLARFGIDVPASAILTSSETTAAYLKKRSPKGATIYVVGEVGLQKAVRDQGFELINNDGLVRPDTRAEYVVAGMTSNVCYKELASASHLINHGAVFVGTNPDVTFPSEMGPLPGAGSILAFLQTATGVDPIVIGKPNRAIFEEAIERLDGEHQTTAMVGDRLNTDIVGAKDAGLKAILLLSGISKEEDIRNSPVQPDWIFKELRDLTHFLETGNRVLKG